jgi:LacI family transcriptional regulator
VAPNAGVLTHISNLLRSGIPIVCLDRVDENIPLDCVAVHNIDGSQMCVRHLIQQGHQRIGIITGSTTLQPSRERLQGYLAALKEAKINVESGLIKERDFH